MKKYIHGDKKSWHFLLSTLGNGGIQFRIMSYGWVSKGNNKDGTVAWADSGIDIGSFTFSWQYGFFKKDKPWIRFHIEKNEF